MSYMKIKPTDTLFFRGGKPFNAGLDSWSDSSFLPHPSVIWGAMFSVLFKEGKVTVADKETLEIKNIYLYNEKQTTILIPAPLDIFVDKEDRNYIAKYEKVEFLSNYPFEVVSKIDTEEEVKPLENHFIDINSLYEHYVRGFSKNLILYNFEDVFTADYKIGIAIDKSKRTAKEGMLYRIDLTQFHDEWSFLVEYESTIEFKSNGILKLGGEGKNATYQNIDEPIGLKSAKVTKKRMDERLKDKRYFKVLFKTPTYFKCGWEPAQAGLVCANVGKYLSIGGWDMETKNHKPMKRYVPAGSVYVFKKEEGVKTPIFQSEDDEAYKGFGAYELLTI
ncbi:MAG: type III-B CRISPR module-associated protein Cmr3 [Sulfuricurvum sp.]